ncbi:MAG: hypothetical protein ABI689_12155, partial [Thermoanaerobaculia bacterium]
MSPLPCPPELWPEFSRLLDLALDRPEADRPGWLEGLPAAHQALLPYLRAVLAAGGDPLADDAFAAIPQRDSDHEAIDESDENAAQTGDRIGPYTLEHELGRGGMGVVWRAARSDGAYERSVALKLPHPHLLGGSIQRRFRRERDILATLSHPNIA